MRRILLGLLSVLIVLALVAGGVVAWGFREYRAPGPAAADVVQVLPHGAGLGPIAAALRDAGVIRREILFVAAVRLTGAAPKLKAGEYRFAAHASLEQVIEQLIQGRTVVHKLTIPEGLLTVEVMALVANAEALTGALPPPPPDGSLLPETYFYSWGDSRAALLGRMQKAMRDALQELWASRKAGLPFARPEQAVILASIVEKETALAGERPHIAGLFLNRLRRGMRLQSDPTVAYGLTNGQAPLGRELSRADLDSDTAFNTYRIEGLPPHPIANPGRAALEAVANPSKTSDLYFVADGTGGHVFSETLEQHNRNVRRWRALHQAPNGK